MKHEGFKGYNVLNIATSDPKSPLELAKAIASNMPKSKLKTRFIPRPNYDVATTWADQTKLEKLIGPLESTNFDKAVKSFVDWYSDQTREIRLNFRS
jgi:nucleoside-diphosphate-sugar epimerase